MDSVALLTPEKAAQQLGLSTRTLANWRCLGGGPPFYKLGGAIRYRVEDLAVWLRGRCFANTGQAAEQADAMMHKEAEDTRQSLPCGRGNYVYVIGDGTGRLKVGFSSDVEKRLSAIRTGNPSARVLRVYAGDRAKERALHRKLAAYHLDREWFEDNHETRHLLGIL